MRRGKVPEDGARPLCDAPARAGSAETENALASAVPGGRYPSRQGLGIDALNAEWAAAALLVAELMAANPAWADNAKAD